MPLDKKDKGYILTSSLVVLGLIITILKWNFKDYDPMSHIKAIYIILLLMAFGMGLYFVYAKVDKK
ncbi:MAG: hypothetical protein GF383_05465 [Candidatus Lokiarchaeota archaeon]|nr:hypothetical protein [Candidatus Lokiarchaeota archaeon]